MVNEVYYKLKIEMFEPEQATGSQTNSLLFNEVWEDKVLN